MRPSALLKRLPLIVVPFVAMGLSFFVASANDGSTHPPTIAWKWTFAPPAAQNPEQNWINWLSLDKDNHTHTIPPDAHCNGACRRPGTFTTSPPYGEYKIMNGVITPLTEDFTNRFVPSQIIGLTEDEAASLIAEEFARLTEPTATPTVTESDLETSE